MSASVVTTDRQPQILVVDDEEVICRLCRDIAQESGMSVQTAGTTEQALEYLFSARVDLLVTDIRIPALGGMELIRRLHAGRPEVGVLVMTGHGTVEMAVEAMHSGVIDYITKPFTVDSFADTLRNVMRVAECNRGRRLFRSQPPDGLPTDRLIGQSLRMKQIKMQVARISDHDSPVLIHGETGTGKEVLARAIHLSGSRASHPLVAIDCAALTPTLIESELFGHEKGAFTGALQAKKGLVETAHKGTLFLDEIGELPRELQSKLLRVLQEREVRRIGSTNAVPVDARVIAATNRELLDEVRAGHFREDLYYRLNVLNLRLPPLRERISDLPILVSAFLERFGSERREITSIAPGVWRKLAASRWPGNVRELENVIERALVLGSGPVLQEADIVMGQDPPGESNILGGEEELSLNALEKQTISRALVAAKGNKAEAARLLGIGTTTLYRKLKQ
jgi:DNA-binding NtrC family response regulator